MKRFKRLLVCFPAKPIRKCSGSAPARRVCRSVPGRAHIAVVLLIGIVLGSVAAAEAGQGVLVDADTQYRYAEHLFSSGAYLSAISEYRRFNFLFPQDPRREAAMFGIGDAFMALGQWGQAVQAFSSLLQNFADGSFAEKSYFRISDALLEMGRTASAVTNLFNLAKITDNVDAGDEAFYRIGWIYLKMAEWRLAQESFAKISAKNRAAYRLRELDAQVNEAAAEKRKRPGLAGALSIVPGGGYVYCERYQDALIALLLNGGLILAAAEAFQNELYALGGVIAFVEVGFYAGNIYGSVASAHKYNRRQDQKAFERMKKNFNINLSARPATKGLELALKIPF